MRILGHARVIKNAHLRTCREHPSRHGAPRNKNASTFCGAFGVVGRVSTRRVRRTMRMKKRTRNLLGENFSNRNAYTSNEAVENKDESANQRPELFQSNEIKITARRVRESCVSFVFPSSVCAGKFFFPRNARRDLKFAASK